MKQTNEHLTVIEVFRRIKTARETVGKNCITDWYITNGGLIETTKSANTYRNHKKCQYLHSRFLTCRVIRLRQ